MTNERKIIAQMKFLNEKMDSIITHMQAKGEQTWVTGRFLVNRFGITQFDLRALCRAGLKTKGSGNSKRYLLQSFPEQVIKKGEVTSQ